MDCYFSAYEYGRTSSDGKSAVVMFHIPDVGIRFKAPFAAVDKDHGNLASLLALLEFIDSNQKYFSNHTFQIYGDNLSIINQVNGDSAMRGEFSQLLNRANKYREKYHFSLEWVPSSDNPAVDSLLD
ncbi:MAG: reverse transcriptase-like protein [candidate division Zixibacteria bacterium]|nr:reverse transcriptase-like protein [candidate division Zixibacteria bacterium]